MTALISIEEGVVCLKQGGVIGYPTEGVYGLGCMIDHEKAVERILSLKRRSVSKGLIVLVYDWQQLHTLVAPLSEEAQSYLKEYWPGPVTFLCPKADGVPDYLTGGQPQIAIRMTAHPVARALCKDSPIVSTSANLSTEPAASSIEAFLVAFPEGVDGLVRGALGGQQGPTKIIDVMTKKQYR